MSDSTTDAIDEFEELEATSTHTPGPWMADGYLVCIPEDNAKIFLKMDTMPDASLIAAAPELLAALKAVIHHYSDYLDDPLNKEARAAIAKAEGTS